MYDLQALLRLIGRKGLDYVRTILTSDNLPEVSRQELSKKMILLNGKVNEDLLSNLCIFYASINSYTNSDTIKKLLRMYGMTTLIEILTISDLSDDQKDALSKLHVFVNGHVCVSTLYYLQKQIDQETPNDGDVSLSSIKEPSIA